MMMFKFKKIFTLVRIYVIFKLSKEYYVYKVSTTAATTTTQANNLERTAVVITERQSKFQTAPLPERGAVLF
jgi:hypothetical protein